MLQMFSLDVAKVDMILHLLQLLGLSTRGYGGGAIDRRGKRADADRDGAGVGHKVARDTERTWDTD